MMTYKFYISLPCNLLSSGNNEQEAFENLKKDWKNRVPDLLSTDIVRIEDEGGNVIMKEEYNIKR